MVGLTDGNTLEEPRDRGWTARRTVAPQGLMRFTERRLPCYARTATKPIAMARRYGSATVRRAQSAVAMNTQESQFSRLIWSPLSCHVTRRTPSCYLEKLSRPSRFQRCWGSPVPHPGLPVGRFGNAAAAPDVRLPRCAIDLQPFREKQTASTPRKK
jgi:hypothetical protein